MKRWLAVLMISFVAAIAPQSPALATAGFHDVTLTMEGPNALITFRETGLDPGQNYAYLPSGGFTETFQCYRDNSFTPTRRTQTLSGSAGEDPRVYTANERGVVRGFVYLWASGPWPEFCPARQSEVPVYVCFYPSDLLNFAKWDVYWFPDTSSICGPIEPD
jgi:hypothetical protein